jgi:hypothetical protein
LGVGAKYTIRRLSKDFPADMAGYVNYETASITNVGLSNLAFSAVISKEYKKDLTPYGMIGVTQLNYSYKDDKRYSVSSNALTLGLGLKYQMKKDFVWLFEVSTFTADSSGFTTFGVSGMSYL